MFKLNLVDYSVFFVTVLFIPITLYFIHRKNPQWFSGRKIFLWLIGAIIFTFICINAIYWLHFLYERGGITGITFYEAKRTIHDIEDSFLLGLFFIIIPMFLCFMHYKNPQWFSGWKIFLWLIGTALFSSIYMNTEYWFPILGRDCRCHAAEYKFSYVAILWVTAIPVVFIYGMTLLIRKFFKSKKSIP